MGHSLTSRSWFIFFKTSTFLRNFDFAFGYFDPGYKARKSDVLSDLIRQSCVSLVLWLFLFSV